MACYAKTLCRRENTCLCGISSISCLKLGNLPYVLYKYSAKGSFDQWRSKFTEGQERQVFRLNFNNYYL
ncbi:hypothetical protein NPIL_404951 [Nephila pilipes]|uniref:Uncharacterized protein n=1 Tax=Nephila pilipes TaxID=299642 RepID=A0A8X6PFB6_NEPPI|nr:hypothetical protein NPIL_404951 [Nephila pilipes]